MGIAVLKHSIAPIQLPVAFVSEICLRRCVCCCVDIVNVACLCVYVWVCVWSSSLLVHTLLKVLFAQLIQTGPFHLYLIVSNLPHPEYVVRGGCAVLGVRVSYVQKSFRTNRLL